jgi:hypothetical protein
MTEDPQVGVPAHRGSEIPEFVDVHTSASFDAVALAEELRKGVLFLLDAHQGDREYCTQVLDSFRQLEESLREVDGTAPVVDALRPVADAARESRRLAQA